MAKRKKLDKQIKELKEAVQIQTLAIGQILIILEKIETDSALAKPDAPSMKEEMAYHG